MNSEFTTSQINALGERLRKGQTSAADLERLDSYRRSFDDVYRTVVSTLRDLGLEPSGRIKTTISIVEKLKRQSFRLSKLQDIAGCRVIVDTVIGQDRVVGLISKVLPNSKVIDRRQKQSHGYRAVHIVVEVNGRFVEIQIRTQLQHLWAVWSEALADKYGQALKYGTGPAEIQEVLTLQSELFGLQEERERAIAGGLKILGRKKAALTSLDALPGKSLPDEVSEWVGHLKDLIHDKQEEKKKITRAILKLRQKRKER